MIDDIDTINNIGDIFPVDFLSADVGPKIISVFTGWSPARMPRHALFFVYEPCGIDLSLDYRFKGRCPNSWKYMWG